MSFNLLRSDNFSTISSLILSSRLSCKVAARTMKSLYSRIILLGSLSDLPNVRQVGRVLETSWNIYYGFS